MDLVQWLKHLASLLGCMLDIAESDPTNDK